MVNFQNSVVQEDLRQMVASELPWKSLQGKTILVTGATGMLATYITWVLGFLRNNCYIDMNVIALCRNEDKAVERFEVFSGSNFFSLMIQDVCCPISVDEDIDYIFHLAGNASPYYIKADPVGIARTNLEGTINVLELAREKSAKVIFASTREVYGKNEEAKLLDESLFGSLDTMDDRSCYPESKRAAETLLRSYWLQYGVETYSVRIAHSYGPTMNLKDDGRVMSDLLGDAILGRDIVLKSTGDAERAFIYITDAVLGMFTVLFNGEAGRAYNLSNEEAPIAIRELAGMIIKSLGNSGQKVVLDIPEEKDRSYCAYKRVGLDTTALRALGWWPKVGLEDGIRRVMTSVKC